MRLSSLSMAAMFIVMVSVGIVQAESKSVLASKQGKQYEVTPVGVMMRFNDAVFGRATTSNSACGCEAKPACGREKKPACGCEKAPTCGCDAKTDCGCRSNSRATCGCENKPACGCDSKPACTTGCTTRSTCCKPQCRKPLLDQIGANLNFSFNGILPCNKCNKSCGCDSKGCDSKCDTGSCARKGCSTGCCESGGQVVPNDDSEMDPFTDDPEPPVAPPVTEARAIQTPFGNGIRQPATRSIGDLQTRNIEPRQPMKQMTMRYTTLSRTRSSIPKPGATSSRRKTDEDTIRSPSDRQTSFVRPFAAQQYVPYSYGNPLR